MATRTPNNCGDDPPTLDGGPPCVFIPTTQETAENVHHEPTPSCTENDKQAQKQCIQTGEEEVNIFENKQERGVGGINALADTQGAEQIQSQPSRKRGVHPSKGSASTQREWQWDSLRAARQRREKTRDSNMNLIEAELAKRDSTMSRKLFGEALSIIVKQRGETHRSNTTNQVVKPVLQSAAALPAGGNARSTRWTKEQKIVPEALSVAVTELQKPGNGAEIHMSIGGRETPIAMTQELQYPGNGAPANLNIDTVDAPRAMDQLQMNGERQSRADCDFILECLLRRISQLESRGHVPRPHLQLPGLGQLRTENRRLKRSHKCMVAARTRPKHAVRATSFRDGTLSQRPAYRPVRLNAASSEQIEASGTLLPAETCWRATARRGVNCKHYKYHSANVYRSSSDLRAQEQEPTRRVIALHAIGTPVRHDQLPTATMRCENEIRPVKLDTCAQFSVAGSKWRRLGTKVNISPPADIVEGFGGGETAVLGVWRFDMLTQYNQKVVVNAMVVEDPSAPFLLGEDWMYDVGAKIDFVTSELKFYRGDTRVIIPFIGSGPQQQRERQERLDRCKVRLVRKAKIRTQSRVTVELPVAAEEGAQGLFVPKRLSKMLELLLAPTVTKVCNGVVRIPVLNIIGSKRKLPKQTTLGTWSPIEKDMEVLSMSGELERSRIKAWVAELTKYRKDTPVEGLDDLDIEETLTPEERALLLQLLSSYPALVEKKSSCPPITTTGVEHHINTGTNPPIRCRSRRYAQSELAVIDEHVDKMLADRVIEPCNGPWGFPVVLVKKKDGSIRFCIDYRALNAVTVKDVYPLPRIDETLDHLRGARFFTPLDLHSGYWQVGVAESDKDKTAFLSRKGLFRFTRMPFGLANAPGTFQRLMDAVLRGLSWQCSMVYLDDIIIFTKGPFERHILEVAAVLERLANAGMSLKPQKCSFAKHRLEYLGHELTEEGIRPMESLVQAVLAYPAPIDVEAVRRFVHLAGYYRRFIRNFASKMSPLTRLLRKNVPWSWDSEQIDAFGNIKRELTERPLLAYPDFTRPFTLETDACMVGLGAVLMQNFGNGLQPVAYASKVNSVAESKYSITDLECAAVVWAIKLFRPYLFGRHFTLATDHIALTWLMTKKEPVGRLYRWALALQEYDFTIRYRKGNANVVADGMSRAPVPHPEPTNNSRPSKRQIKKPTHGPDPINRDDRTGKAVIHLVSTSGQLPTREIKEEQRQSPMVKKLLAAGLRENRQIVRAPDGIVYIEGNGFTTHRQIVLPASLWAKVLTEDHDSIYSGHLRVPATRARVERNYWWPRMGDTVRNWVMSCRDCATRKAKPKSVVPPLRPLKVGSPGDRWALDVAGPLPRTGRGNRYVITAVDYATRYAVARSVANHTARDVARFLMENVILVFGPCRELVMDGAPELNGSVITTLVELLEAEQVTPVPYRPALLGLVERWHRTWKDMVSIYCEAVQDDWDDWLPAALYAYNGSKHSATKYSPNELMMGRQLRSPNELLLGHRVAAIENYDDYHKSLVQQMDRARRLADVVIAQEQARQARYYDKSKVRRKEHFTAGMLVWLYKPPRGKGVTKLAHRWVGPAKILEDAGFDNFRILRLDTQAEVIAHCSFLVSYFYPTHLLGEAADQIMQDLLDEERASLSCGIALVDAEGDLLRRESVDATTHHRKNKYEIAAQQIRDADLRANLAPFKRRTGRKRSPESSSAISLKRLRQETKSEPTLAHNQFGSRGDAEGITYTFAAVPASGPRQTLTTAKGVKLRERRRRRIRNRAGRYVLEFEVEFLGRNKQVQDTRWLSTKEFLSLWADNRIEDPEDNRLHQPTQQHAEDGATGNGE